MYLYLFIFYLPKHQFPLKIQMQIKYVIDDVFSSPPCLSRDFLLSLLWYPFFFPVFCCQCFIEMKGSFDVRFWSPGWPTLLTHIEYINKIIWFQPLLHLFVFCVQIKVMKVSPFGPSTNPGSVLRTRGKSSKVSLLAQKPKANSNGHWHLITAAKCWIPEKHTLKQFHGAVMIFAIFKTQKSSSLSRLPYVPFCCSQTFRIRLDEKICKSCCHVSVGFRSRSSLGHSYIQISFD